MKKRIVVLFLLLSGSLCTFADEGMWIPSLLHKYKIDDMQKEGLKLTAEDLYSINSNSLKDAIVLFGRGCTGGVVSDQGLLLTNHHCGFGQIQNHSSVEHDYLKDGFWAMSQVEELPNPGLKVSFLIYMDDVTDKALEGVAGDMTESQRQEAIARNSEKIIKQAIEGTHYEATVRPFYNGNQFFVYVMEVFRDVRLVGAPPSSIGKFGGDTDNWMWPRHTGDFSVFRIYAGEDNKPADYSPENVPYQPKEHFTVSLEGVEKGDFTMVYGYPYSTMEYIPSFLIELYTEVLYPHAIDIRGKKLEIIGQAMNSDPKIRIQYASKDARIANAWKKWIGVIRGLDRLEAVEKKMSFEEEFRRWAAHPDHFPSYGKLLNDYMEVAENARPYFYWSNYFREAIWSLDIVGFAANYRKLVALEKNEEEKTGGELEKLMSNMAVFFKDYDRQTDKKLFTAMVEKFYKNVEVNRHPDVLKIIRDKFNGDVGAYADWVYEKSMLVDEATMGRFLESYKSSRKKKLVKDPVYQLMNGMYEYYAENIAGEISQASVSQDSLQRLYMAGQMEMQAERHFYSDANATLRVTYGKVNDYYPRDAVYYEYYTTLEGVMEKMDPEIYDYDVPQKLIDIYGSKDYGPYSRTDGTMPVCFIAMNHTTGGNSGSPVLNAEGHLIGLNFDRNWEGTMSDFMYDPEMCRNITLDIRYCLLIIDRFAGAGHLVEGDAVRNRRGVHAEVGERLARHVGGRGTECIVVELPRGERLDAL